MIFQFENKKENKSNQEKQAPNKKELQDILDNIEENYRKCNNKWHYQLIRNEILKYLKRIGGELTTHPNLRKAAQEILEKTNANLKYFNGIEVYEKRLQDIYEGLINLSMNYRNDKTPDLNHVIYEQIQEKLAKVAEIVKKTSFSEKQSQSKEIIMDEKREESMQQTHIQRNEDLQNDSRESGKTFIQEKKTGKTIFKR